MPDTRPSAADVTITACPNGPLLVRGAVRLTGPDGTPIPRTRATIALCRCGKSARAPLCDGTHKAIGFTTPETLPETLP